jgi:hypothetical protein
VELAFSVNSRAWPARAFICADKSRMQLGDLLGRLCSDQVLGEFERGRNVARRETHGLLLEIARGSLRRVGLAFKGLDRAMRRVHQLLKGFPGLFDAVFRERAHFEKNVVILRGWIGHLGLFCAMMLTIPNGPTGCDAASD